MRQTLIVNSRYNHDTNVVGIGIVIHETDDSAGGRKGEVIDRVSESYSGITPNLSEILALYRALEIAIQRDYKVVELMSDCNPLRKSLKKSYEERLQFDRPDLYGKILNMTTHFDTVKFGLKPGRKNQTARGLSLVGTKEMEPLVNEYFVEICCTSSPRLTKL
ncbi:MAG: ribonuclease HI [Flavobacteriales bacterium]|jgi:ribonuclease HI